MKYPIMAAVYLTAQVSLSFSNFRQFYNKSNIRLFHPMLERGEKYVAKKRFDFFGHHRYHQ